MKNIKVEIEIILRPVVVGDAEMLHRWRNDEETRRQSVNMDMVPFDSHIAWLTKSLTNPNRKLLIAEIEGKAVGTVRLDIEEDKEPQGELSWTIAPEFRGRGLGIAMVGEAVNYFARPLRIIVKPGNIPSQKIAEKVGFHKVSESPEMTSWVYQP